MNEIIIEIRGGTLVEIYSNNKDCRAIVVDWDDIEEEKSQRIGICSCSSYSTIPNSTRDILAQSDILIH